MKLYTRNNKVLISQIALILISQHMSSCKSHHESFDKVILSNWSISFGDTKVTKIGSIHSKWDTISVDDYWENKKHIDYDGYAWYKTDFILPSSLRDGLSSKDSIKIFLGPIDDCDQVYLNQVIIGENNVSLQGNTAAKENFADKDNISDLDRKYFIAVNDQRIRWGKENTLAIRVFDHGGNGGLHTYSVPFVGIKDLGDQVLFNFDKFYKVDEKQKVDTVLVMSNESPENLNGAIEISLRNLENGKITYTERQQVDVFSGVQYSIPISLPVNVASSLMTISYEDKLLKVKFSKSTIIPYVLIR